MKTSDFDFLLPDYLIAQHPPRARGESRLITLDRLSGKRRHLMINNLPEILCEDFFLSSEGRSPLLVFNDTKVRKARVIGRSQDTGAEVEFLLTAESPNDASNHRFSGNCWKAMAKRARRKKEGSVFNFFDSKDNVIAKAAITGFEEGHLLLEFDRVLDNNWFDKYGHVPLPPYIKRKDAPQDTERYQTVYAKETGSAAAPTAGLHFTRELLEKLKVCGIESEFLTLHVGLGTFLPVRTENIKDHIMHEEQFFITEESAKKIIKAKSEGRKIIAVGTTSLRALESAFFNGSLKSGLQKTSIFIYPGYNFKIADALFTNFHTPQSTLLMLVCAFAGKELILDCYTEAVKKEYRFFSYGDAMLIY